MRITYLYILSCVLFLNGCISVGPDYQRPSVPIADYSDLLGNQGKDAGPSGNIDSEALADWWACFNDLTLSQLMDEALKKNLDLREARALVREARSQLIIDRADGLPQVNANGDYTRERTSANTQAGRNAENLVTDTYNAGFDASWEVDIWGGNRRAVEAAKADIMAEEANLESVKVSLAGELARTYVQIRTYQERIRVTKKNVEAQAETLAMLESKLRAGLSDELSVEQARYNLEDTRSALPDLFSGLESSINSLSVLTGNIPGKLHEQLSASVAVPVPPFEIVNDIPADTLRQRPDVRKAEWSLAAQTARIGEAEADLYPNFSLTGSIGLSALTSSSFFSSDSKTWSLVPGLHLPIFNAGSIRANIKVQEAKQEQMVAQYQNTVLSAIKEIRNALTDFYQEQQRLKVLESAVTAAQNAVKIAQDKYRNGLVDFNNVLDAQRSLYSFENNMVASRGAVTKNFISLYKALGGGWSWDPQETLSADTSPTKSACADFVFLQSSPLL